MLWTKRGCGASTTPAMEQRMADQDPRTAKLMALVETSSVREAEAATNAIERARETLQGFGSFEGMNCGDAWTMASCLRLKGH